MPTIEQDRIFFQRGIAELSDYLLSGELYWTLSPPRGACLSRLTIGGLLLSRLRLWARAVSPVEQVRLERLDRQLEAIRSRWRVAWEQKVSREIRARLDLWRNYLMDYRQSPEVHADEYLQEVRWRVILNLLFAELPVPSAETEALAGLDQLLQTSFLPGGFIWEKDLMSGFPQQAYWFLYGRLKSN